MKCPHCNQEHPEGYIFCPFIGEKLIQLKACTLNPDCPEHGKFIWPLDSIFCPRCGSILEGWVDESTARVFTINGVSFKMINVEGGTFTMGWPWETDKKDLSLYGEIPAHQVTLSSFAIGQTEVTQALWEAIMGSNPSKFNGSNRPVETVSWEDCQEFLSRLNRATGECFRLPTEAEWEYAARGGNLSQGYIFSGSDNLDDVAWYLKNSGVSRLTDEEECDRDKIKDTINNNHCQTHPVGTKRANELGLYDMSGNVREWCSDNWHYYDGSASKYDFFRVFRGGGWDDIGWDCRVSCRDSYSPVFRADDLGLRLAL